MSKNLKILIVDDNEEFCSNTKDILELRDYEIVVAYDGFKGLEAVKENDFGLVLMDVKMPVMNGVETFKKIKEMTPKTPVIMITAFAVEELIKEALQQGAYGSLKKPVNFDQLFELIELATDKGAMILIADDDDQVREMIEHVLSDKGYRVAIANDGQQAVDMAKTSHFDIMLLDMKMPVLNGLETYLAIRKFRPDIVTIVITGYKQEFDSLVHQVLRKGAYACLEKPIDIDSLIHMIEQIVQIKEQKKSGTLKKHQ